MFKAVTGASTHDPDILRFGMVVQNKILVCRVLVLADPALHQWRIRKRWKTKPYIRARGS